MTMRLPQPSPPNRVALVIEKCWDLTVWCGGCGRTRTWSPSDLAAQFRPEVTDHQIAGRMTCACGAGWGWIDYRQNHSAQVAKGGIGPARADTFAMPDLGAQGQA